MMGTVGHPVRQSLSPNLQTTLGVMYDEDIVYLAYDITADKIGDFVNAMKTLGIIGCNVTMPCKEAIIPYLDQLDKFAQKCGAVNVVKNDNGELVGYNVDADGFRLALHAHGLDYKDKKVIVIGAGGAAKSIIESAVDNGVAKIWVFNRTVEKAEKLIKGRQQISVHPYDEDALKVIATGADLIVNTTSLGMTGNNSDYKSFDFLDDTKAIIAEVVYHPLKTPLLLEAEKRGLEIVKGIEMLIYQAFLTFEIVTGRQTNFDRDYQTIENMLVELLEDL